MNWLDAFIIAVVEGLTEFLPISSTGHMIITNSLLGITPDEFTKAFMINIQFGAILSVVIMYFKRFFKSIRFYRDLLIAFIPAAILGFLLGDAIDALLENVMVVCYALIGGGIILVFIDKLTVKIQKNDEMTPLKAFIIGCFQTLALVPGVSRSAATIIGGMTRGLSRKAAAEFSFFLAVPTMFAASAYKLYKTADVVFVSGNIPILLFGNFIAFITALLAIKGFIAFLNKFGFQLFGWYRIALGIIILVVLYSGHSLTIL